MSISVSAVSVVDVSYLDVLMIKRAVLLEMRFTHSGEVILSWAVRT